MGIEKLNLSNLFKKNVDKTENKGKNLPLADETKQVSEKSYKSYSNATKTAVLAALMAGGFNSCVEQTVDLDNSALLALMNEYKQLAQANNEKLDELIKLAEQNNKDNQVLIELMRKMLAEQQATNNILTSIDGHVENIEGSLYDLYAVQEKMYGNDEEYLALLRDIRDGQGDSNEKLKKMLDAIKEHNETLMSIYTLVASMSGDLSSKLSDLIADFNDGKFSMNELLTNIFNEIKNGNETSAQNDEEFKAKLDAIIAGQGSNSEKLSQLTDAVNEQTKFLANIQALIAGVGEELSGKLSAIFFAYQHGEITHTMLLAQIKAEMVKSNEFSQAQLDAINKIFAQMNANQLSESEAIQRIIELLGLVVEKLDVIIGQLATVIDGIEAQSNEMRAFQNDFKGFREDYKKQSITSNAFAAEIAAGIAKLNITDSKLLAEFSKLQKDIKNHNISEDAAHAQLAALLKQVVKNTDTQNTISALIVGKLTSLETALQNQTITVEEAINSLTGILNQIQENTSEIANGLAVVSGQIANLTDKFDSYQDKSLYLLAGIKGNTASINNKLNQVIKNQNDAKGIMIQSFMKMDEATGLLYRINGKTVTKNDLKNLLGDLFNKVEPYLKNIQDNTNIDLSEVIDAIQATKTEMAESNAYLNVITGILKELNLKDTGDIQGILDRLDTIINKGGAAADNITELLRQALGELATIGANTAAQVQLLKDIKDDTGAIKSKLDDLLKKADQHLTVLNSLNQKTITIGDLKNLLGSYYSQVEPYLKKIGSGNGTEIDLADVINAINANKVDLTKTNHLIETLTNVVQHLDFSGGTGYDPTQLNKIYEMLEQIHRDGVNGAENTQKLLSNAIEILQNIKTTGGSQLAVLDAILEVAKELAANQNTAMQNAVSAEANLFQKLGDIINAIKAGGSNTDDLLKAFNEYSGKALQAQADAQQARADQFAVLEAILENMGAGEGGSGITIEQLKQILPDYTAILEEINSKLGKVVTSSDLQNYYLKTQPDLTKTNHLIETLTNVVQHLNLSGSTGGSDMTRVETLLGQILDALSGERVPTADQIEAMIEALNKLVANTTSSSPANARAAMILDAINEGELLAAKITNKPATYQTYLGSHLYGNGGY